MALGRIYTIVFTRVTVTAAQDLWNIAATANMAFELHSMELSCETATTPEELSVQIKRLTATVTNGTGGSAATITPTLSSQAAATITGRINDTGRATTSGSTTVLYPATWQMTNGYIYLPAPEDRFSFALSQNCLIGLEVAPAASHVMSGVITVAELF